MMLGFPLRGLVFLDGFNNCRDSIIGCVTQQTVLAFLTSAVLLLHKVFFCDIVKRSVKMFGWRLHNGINSSVAIDKN